MQSKSKFAQRYGSIGVLVIYYTKPHLLILTSLNHQKHMVTNVYLMHYWTNNMLIVQGEVCYLLGPRGTELCSEFKSV